MYTFWPSEHPLGRVLVPPARKECPCRLETFETSSVPRSRCPLVAMSHGVSDEAGDNANVFDKIFDTTLDLHVVLGMCGHVWACVGPIWAPKKGMCTLKSQIRALLLVVPPIPGLLSTYSVPWPGERRDELKKLRAEKATTPVTTTHWRVPMIGMAMVLPGAAGP